MSAPRPVCVPFLSCGFHPRKTGRCSPSLHERGEEAEEAFQEAGGEVGTEAGGDVGEADGGGFVGEEGLAEGAGGVFAVDEDV